MVILRKLLKILLTPAVIILFLIKWIIELTVRISSALVGLFILYVITCMVYCLWVHRWSDFLILMIAGLSIVLILFILVGIQEWCDSMSDKIRSL